MGEAANDTATPEELARRLAWFNESTARIGDRPADLPLRCPCCGCKTLDARCDYDICRVCFWEDDGQDNHDAAEVRGGPNGLLSLQEARSNYVQFGACELSMVENVRPPLPGEMPE